MQLKYAGLLQRYNKKHKNSFGYPDHLLRSLLAHTNLPDVVAPLLVDYLLRAHPLSSHPAARRGSGLRQSPYHRTARVVSSSRGFASKASFLVYIVERQLAHVTRIKFDV